MIFFYVDDIIIIVYFKYYITFLNFKTKLIKEYEMRDISEFK